jgi:hypothetical protein
MYKKRWKYYIDKNFQNHFIFQFSLLILLNTILTIGLIFLVREKSYNLLPNNASVLVQVDVNEAIYISKDENDNIHLNEELGKPFFPLKQIEGSKPKLYNAFDLYLTPIIMISLLNLISVSIFSLFFSHKMAGPIYKIKKILTEYTNNEKVEAITLRKGDFFHDLAHLINKALKLEKRKDEKK